MEFGYHKNTYSDKIKKWWKKIYYQNYCYVCQEFNFTKKIINPYSNEKTLTYCSHGICETCFINWSFKSISCPICNLCTNKYYLKNHSDRYHDLPKTPKLDINDIVNLGHEELELFYAFVD